MKPKRPETLRERSATGSTLEPWERLRDATSGPQPPFLYSWCDNLHDPVNKVTCPCRTAPEPCRCGGPTCPRPPRAPRAYVRARRNEPSLDDTVNIALANLRRTA